MSGFKSSQMASERTGHPPSCTGAQFVGTVGAQEYVMLFLSFNIIMIFICVDFLMEDPGFEPVFISTRKGPLSEASQW